MTPNKIRECSEATSERVSLRSRSGCKLNKKDEFSKNRRDNIDMKKARCARCGTWLQQNSSSFCDSCFEVCLHINKTSIPSINVTGARKTEVYQSYEKEKVPNLDCFLVEIKRPKTSPATSAPNREINAVKKRLTRGWNDGHQTRPSTRERDAYFSLTKLTQPEVFALRESFGKTKKSSAARRLDDLAKIFDKKGNDVRKEVERKTIQAKNEGRFASVKLQKLCRRFAARRLYFLQRRGFILLQAIQRGVHVRSTGILAVMRRQRKASIVIQCISRQFLAKLLYVKKQEDRKRELKLLKERLEQQRGYAALSLQRICRGHKAQIIFKGIRRKVICMQNLWRVKCAKKKRKLLFEVYMTQKRAATLIQKSCLLAFRARQRRIAREQKARLQSTLKLQRVRRGVNSRRETASLRSCITRLESLWGYFEDNLNKEDFSDEESHYSEQEEEFIAEGEVDLVFTEKLHAKIDTKIDFHLPLRDFRLHFALWILCMKQEYERAINLFRQVNEDDDARVSYALAVALRMSSNPTVKRKTLASMVSDAKAIDGRGPSSFLSASSQNVRRPGLTEIDAVFLRAVKQKDRAQNPAHALCNFGVYRLIVHKDIKGAEYFFKQALEMNKADTFVLGLYYGKNAKTTAAAKFLPDLVAADFDTYICGSLPSYSRENLLIGSRQVRKLEIHERLGLSKWHRKYNDGGVLDLLFIVHLEKPNPSHRTDLGRIENENEMLLAIANDTLRTWTKFLDMPELLKPVNKSKLFRMLISDLDIVKTSSGGDKLALRFRESSVGTTTRLTGSGFHLSINIFLEECTRLRLCAYSEKLDTTFNLLLNASDIKALCIDQPRMKRIFEQTGFRSAISHCKLVAKVTSLIELTKRETNSQEKNKYYYVKNQKVLIGSKLVSRDIETQLEKCSNPESEWFASFPKLQETQLIARQHWGASKIQALARGVKGRRLFRRIKRNIMATRIQKCWHGRVARRFFNAVRKEWIRNQMVTKIASVMRGHWTRQMFKERLCQLMQNPYMDASKPLIQLPTIVSSWDTVWRSLNYQRMRSICDLNESSRSRLADAILWNMSFDQNFELASCLLSTALKMYPDDSMFLYMGGLLLSVHLLEPCKALKVFQKARLLDPDNIAFNQAKTHYFARGAFAQDENSYRLLMYAMVCLHVDHDSVAAKRLVNRAIEFSLLNVQENSNQLTVIDGGSALDTNWLKDFDQSCSTHLKAPIISFPLLRWHLHKIEEADTKRTRATILIQQTWRKFRKMPNMVLDMVYKIGRIHAAYQSVKDNIKIENIQHVLDYCFMVHSLKHDFNQADEIYQRCIDHFPDKPVFKFGFSILLLSSGEKELGMSYLEKAFEEDDDAKSFVHADALYFSKAPKLHHNQASFLARSELNLGLIRLYISKDFYEARKHLYAAVNTDPANFIARTIYEDFIDSQPTVHSPKAQLKIANLSNRKLAWLRKAEEFERLKEERKQKAIGEGYERIREAERQRELEILRAQEKVLELEREKKERDKMFENDLLMQGKLQIQKRANEEAVLSQREIAERRKQARKQKKRKNSRKPKITRHS